MATKAVPRKNYTRKIQSYIFLIVLVLVVAGVYGFFQYQRLAEAKGALSDGQARLSQLQTDEEKIASQYADFKKTYDNEFTAIRAIIEGVLPSDEQYTDLTITLEKYVNDLNKSALNPIFMSDLKFSKPRIDTAQDYSVLPFTLTLSTTRENFDNFLRYVENSGALDPNGQGESTRLLDIRSISINFMEQGASTLSGTSRSSVPLMNVSIAMNAYFQIPTDVEL